jgi:outer membrane receptor protein involved in Fe transport
MPSPARADSLELPISIGDGPLPLGLKALESQTGVELLYDGDVVRDLRSPSIVGTLTTEAALQQMLSETELTVRRASSGAWIIERQTTAPLAQQDAAVAEILVVGRRTQNADIRRFEQDVQPYVVATQEEILSAHRDNIDQFISSRITSSTTTIPSIASQSGNMMSSIDLRGMGTLDSIVLVDGRRMPSIPEWNVGFRQADLNAIPLHSIERIEVLTGTAGGIHGFGALGGVVNVVLDRDVDGLELHTTQGISSRGDARRHGMEARFGKAFRDGATSFMLSASHQELDTVLVGDREFASRDSHRSLGFASVLYPLQFRHGNSLAVRSWLAFDPDTGEVISDPKLRFKPEFGGGELGSNLTYLPLGFSGDAPALVNALMDHAGQVDFSLDGNAAKSDLGPNPHSDAVLANFRHRFESGWEAYADAVMLRNQGESLTTPAHRLGFLSGQTIMAPESPANPFTDYILVNYPILILEGGTRQLVDNSRYTAGIEGELPFDWRGTLEAGWGELRYFTSIGDELPMTSGYFLFGDESDLETNPLGNWDEFQRLITTDVLRSREDKDLHTRFETQSLRLAGPVFETPAGPATLTLLAERRSERLTPSTEAHQTFFGSTPITSEFQVEPRSRITRSLYGELRSRLFDESARVSMLRGLELQLAVRRDEQEDDFTRDPAMPDPGMIHTRFASTAYTIGAKVSPARWLTLRGSYSTGEQPPPPATLVESDPATSESGDPDPKRGGTLPGADVPFVVLLSGNSKLQAARASTVFLGVVLTPIGQDGPRLALDYSRIHRARDVRSYTYADMFALEDHFPERVVRAPLTDEDRANGYTGGRIEMIDLRLTNDASMEVETFDLHAEWPLEFLNGRLRLYADATHHKRNERKNRFEPGVRWDGYLDGPLKRRANGGFDWSRNQLTVGANLQYFGSSNIYDHDPLAQAAEERLIYQGSARIPSQSYLDLYGTWRLETRNLGPVDSFSFDFGIVNVLDTVPPRESVGVTLHGPGYSRYGDARQRRFELGLSCQF